MSSDLFEFMENTDTDEYCLNFIGASLSGSDLDLVTELRHDIDGSVERWIIRCLSVREHIIELGYCGHDLQVFSDHVLLWPHVMPTASLYFHGIAADPAAVVGALYASHIKLAGRWVPFDRWFNQLSSLMSLTGAAYGLLAEGPEPLITSYAQVMERFGFETSVLSRPAIHWDGARFVESTGPLVALVSEPTYVIAAEIRSERVRQAREAEVPAT